MVDKNIIADDGEKDRYEWDLARKIMEKVLSFLAEH